MIKAKTEKPKETVNIRIEPPLIQVGGPFIPEKKTSESLSPFYRLLVFLTFIFSAVSLYLSLVT